jgi:DNA-binding Lrp family transcriptional regulator
MRIGGHLKDLDRIDFAILDALQNDGRLSNKELAARVGLAPSSCLARVRALHEEGVLLGYRAKVSPHVLGVRMQALISIRLKVHSRENFDAFSEHVRSLPEVLGAFQLAGADDFLLHVGVRDPNHLRDLTMDAFATREEVDHIETALVFEHWRPAALPNLIQAEAG